MAATNFTPIQLYFSTTASAVPTAANLAQGELAINITDGKLYYEDGSGVVQVIATKGAGTIGGSTTQIQYNNSGALAGNAAMVFNNSTSVTTLTTLNLTNALGATFGGTAQSTYAQGDILYSSATNTLAKLGIGAVNYILTSTGTVPQWVAPSSIAVLTATNLAGGLAGSVPYQSALDTTTFLAIGAANRVMTSTGTAPQWVTALTGLTGVSSSSITNTGLTATRVVFSSTAGLQSDSASLTFDGTTLSAGGYSTTGLSTLVKTVKIGDSSFNGVAVFAAATPAKLYMGTGTVTDVTSAISATNTTGAIASLAITPIAATNTGVTYTNASTLYIAGAPSASTNVTITNPYSLYIAAGAAYFGGAVTVAGSLSLAAVTVTSLTDSGLTSGRVTYAGTGGLLQDSANLTFSGTILTSTGFAGPLNGTVGATTATTGAFTTLTASSTLTVTGAGSIEGLTVGRGAGAVATNTAVGASALAANTTGVQQTVIGASAGVSITTNSYLSAVGYQAAYYMTDSNDAFGRQALFGQSGATGYYNVAVGFRSGYSMTSGTLNTAIGNQALQANTTASNNTAVGYQALYSNTTGTPNTAVGYQALYSNTTGTDNHAVGWKAANANTTGTSLNAFGTGALLVNTTGVQNTAIGHYSLQANTTGNYNVACGQTALGANTTGQGNTGIGYWGLFGVTTGSGNVGIGAMDSAINNAPVFNITTQNNRVYIGSTAVTNAYVQVAWTVVSDARDKTNFAPITHGLDFVKQLNPLSFQFKKNRESDVAHGPVRYGFKAQEILALEGNNPVIIDNEDSEKLRYNGEALVPVLVKALQELNAKFDAYVATHP